MMELYSRMLAYLEKLPAAISGSGGHNATLRVACECFRFGLERVEAWDALQWYNANRCSPAWNEKELRHKLDDAEKIVCRTGEQGARVHIAAGRRALRAFVPPPPPERYRGRMVAPTIPVCQRSAADEELWWAKVAQERGAALEAWDHPKRRPE